LNSELINKIQNYITKIYKEKSPDENIYHNIYHTTEVVNVAKELGETIGVTDDELEALIIAAWFHDVGYVEKCEGHELASSAIAREFLESQNYPENKIQRILELIKVTRIPQRPKNLLQEIICDADLHHLGVKDFDVKGEMLRREIEKYLNKEFSDVEWLRNNMMFFKHQEFFTQAGRDRFEVQKNINFNKIKEKLQKAEKKKKDK